LHVCTFSPHSSCFPSLPWWFHRQLRKIGPTLGAHPHHVLAGYFLPTKTSYNLSYFKYFFWKKKKNQCETICRQKVSNKHIWAKPSNLMNGVEDGIGSTRGLIFVGVRIAGWGGLASFHFFFVRSGCCVSVDLVGSRRDDAKYDLERISLVDSVGIRMVIISTNNTAWGRDSHKTVVGKKIKRPCLVR
jgi:hypothetical protein